MEQVRGALVTGGDPVMDKEKLIYLLDRLVETKTLMKLGLAPVHCLPILAVLPMSFATNWPVI
ncbi:MAG: hypothetical protein HC896_16890 [Bacteroidales bacterium]|nr:hypothetical protein [Bacteroidales bacterium]